MDAIEKAAKELSLDVWERCLFWFVASYFIAEIGSIFGYSCCGLFFTVLLISCATVIFIDRLKIDPRGKAVLITGCDTGFGNSIARRLHEMGYVVFAGVYSTSTDGAKQLKEDFADRMYVFSMDVTSEEDVKNALHYVQTHMPENTGLWAVITNAGWSTFGEVEWIPMDVHERVININLFGTIRTIRAALPLIRKSHGRVITVASMCGRFGIPQRSAYTCSKFAVEGLTECLRAEMKKWGVHVACIEPGNFVAATSIYAGDAVKRQADHMWNNMSQEVRDAYTREYFDKMVEKMSSYTVGGNCSIEPVIKSICDSVTHTFPQTRYQIFSPYEKVRCFAATHFPSILYDMFYN